VDHCDKRFNGVEKKSGSFKGKGKYIILQGCKGRSGALSVGFGGNPYTMSRRQERRG